MRCLTVAIALCMNFQRGSSQELNSLNAISLIAPQIDFFEDMCFNRTGNETLFEGLRSTLEDCQSTVFNGTELSLTYNTLVYTDPEVFYEFYVS
jgi:hypothetical protein